MIHVAQAILSSDTEYTNHFVTAPMPILPVAMMQDARSLQSAGVGGLAHSTAIISYGLILVPVKTWCSGFCSRAHIMVREQTAKKLTVGKHVDLEVGLVVLQSGGQCYIWEFAAERECCLLTL